MHENKPGKEQLIRDESDPRFLALCSLQNHTGRSRFHQYIIEGIRHVARALEHHAPIQSLFVDPSRLSNRFGRRLADRVVRSGVPGARLSPRLYGRLTLAAEPQGIGAVVRQHWTSISDISPAHDSLWLAIESIDSPGNLGTIIRTAEAAGVSGIFMIGGDPWHPATVRATMGSIFAQKLVSCSAWEFIRWAKLFSVAVVGSSPAGLLDYRAWPCRWPAVLLVGSEKRGLSDQLTQATDFVLRIPMMGHGDSINAAVAAGILLYEMFGQRRAPDRASKSLLS